MIYQSKTLSTEDRAKIAAYLETVPTVSKGLGTREEPCSVAAGNLALTGELTDERPACMSPVVHRWVIEMQDRMPDEIRNSNGWRALILDAFGSNDGRDEERRTILLDWIFGTVLPIVQPVADAGGYGDEWRAMREQRTDAATRAAVDAAYAAAARAAEAAGNPDAWPTIDPVGMLRRLITLEKS